MLVSMFVACDGVMLVKALTRERSWADRTVTATATISAKTASIVGSHKHATRRSRFGMDMEKDASARSFRTPPAPFDLLANKPRSWWSLLHPHEGVSCVGWRQILTIIDTSPKKDAFLVVERW
eukprot:CAMPEP_0198132952 /NCGR_PEP_ID=MMETSP1442-20131203/59315_1 /TAXON_ID= /ORGANISM="Craspedostauros australis, Strain CCMP3328" /LENGTH=122 /DNA_ID=CAMNT_0043794055 /DNA_START=499 /DNA_END=864 /DNA_ORIENTATION=+